MPRPFTNIKDVMTDMPSVFNAGAAKGLKAVYQFDHTGLPSGGLRASCVPSGILLPEHHAARTLRAPDGHQEDSGTQPTADLPNPRDVILGIGAREERQERSSIGSRKVGHRPGSLLTAKDGCPEVARYPLSPR